jgi:hypothetical protein
VRHGKYGDERRSFRNGFGLAVPAADQIKVLRRVVRYLLAIERVKTKAKQHNLTDEQKGQLRERESTKKAAAESALLKLYPEVLLPKVDGSGIGIESVSVGGRPLQTTLNEKRGPHPRARHGAFDSSSEARFRQRDAWR